MAEDTTFETPPPLDLTDPSDLRRWFYASGRHYPEESEEKMLREIPALLEKAQSLATQKERDDYTAYLQERYTRDPLVIPARYSRENLSARGVPAQDIRKLQDTATLTPQNIFSDLKKGNLPKGVEAMLPLAAMPDKNEPLDAYQPSFGLSSGGLFPFTKNEIRKRLNTVASLDWKRSPQGELIRRGIEDYTQTPTPSRTLDEKLGDMLGYAVGPIMPVPPFSQGSVLRAISETGQDVMKGITPMRKKRIKDAILGRATKPVTTSPEPEGE